MDEFNKCIKETEEILICALDEFKKAEREKDEMLGRQVCEKAYLGLIKTFNVFFIKRGKKIDELPQT